MNIVLDWSGDNYAKSLKLNQNLNESKKIIINFSKEIKENQKVLQIIKRYKFQRKLNRVFRKILFYGN